MTQAVDPVTRTPFDADGNPITRATPLTKATGKEVGLRLNGLLPGLQTSLSLWRLDLVSELVFVGDEGTTEAGRPSRRTGIEIANDYTQIPGWIIDADLAWPGGLRLRYFGGRPLIEDNSVRSGSSTLVNARLGYAVGKDVKVVAEVLNLFNRRVSDVDYFL